VKIRPRPSQGAPDGDPYVILEDIRTFAASPSTGLSPLIVTHFINSKVHLVTYEDELKDEALRVGCE
jgi:hypothetical protein